MSDITHQAAKGNRKALELLYRNNKQKVYYISLLLTGSENEAQEILKQVFRDMLRSAEAAASEEEFSRTAAVKTAEYCRQRQLKKDPRSFRLPQKQNFLITDETALPDSGEKTSVAAIKSLPVLHRYIFVLRNVAGFSPEQTADMLKFDIKTLTLALKAEEQNISRIIGKRLGIDLTYSDFIEEINSAEKEAGVPQDADGFVSEIIDSIASPAEKKRKRKAAVISAAAVVICAAAALTVFLAARGQKSPTLTDSGSSDSSSETTDSSVISKPVIDLDDSLTYYADIDIADYGNVTVKLDQEAAPVTVANFVNLAQNGFYDGLTFHRIIEGFMMQGGDPNGDGTGGSDRNIVGEFSENGYDNTLSHTRGAISMARSNDYNSASSQFFIVHEDNTESLDGKYAAFGYVTEGMDIVDEICESANPTDENGTIAAEDQPVINTITIRTE